tara:strand:+ start:207 stop:410 length:204 start_codon:yes stop_codon:yes gene_type:complete
MTTYIASKFKAHMPLMKEAVEGTVDLRSNQKIYKKIYKYYKDLGVRFTGDSHEDYETVLDCLYEDMN